MMEPREEDTADIQIGVSIAVLELSDGLAGEIERRLEQAVNNLLRNLGVPGDTRATLVRSEPASGVPLAFTIADIPCPVPEALLPFLDMYLRGEHNVREEDTTALLRRLVVDAAAVEAGAPLRCRLVEFVALAGETAVSRHPSACWNNETFRVWSRDSAAPVNPPGWLPDALRELLGMGVSIADCGAIAAALLTSAGDSRETFIEELLDGLAPVPLSLRINRELLQRATMRGDARNAVDLVANAVYASVGLPLPEVRIEANADLPPDTIAVTINHLPAAPRLGLPASKVLVGQDIGNITKYLIHEAYPDTLMPTLFPGTTEPAVLMSESMADGLPSVTYGAWEHLLQWFAAEVQAHAWRLVSRRVVGARLDALRYGAPSLVEAVQQQIGLVRLTRILRRLVVDGVPIANLLHICDELLLGSAGAYPADADEQEVASALRADLLVTEHRPTGSSLT